ncbi:hypothetical protein [uncultured Nostoc sp.]|uniref:hypothetical protein n=1 Tax=uncultured Nostoc sp. TaxID=340711 RepID=UPI0035C95E74
MFSQLKQKIKSIVSTIILMVLIITGMVVLPNNSALADTNCACVTSEAQPQNGQKTRSSGNFSTQGCTSTVSWILPPNVTLGIYRDVSGGKDKFVYDINNGVRTPNSNLRNLYAGNPRGANSPFQVCALNVD